MASTIPRAALFLGWSGVIPFAGLTALLVSNPQGTPWALPALVAYGAIILSFMGGVHWGIALNPATPADSVAKALTLSVMPALAAFGATFLPAPLSLAVLAAGFAALLAYDLATVRRGAAPAWYAPLRIQLSAAVLARLITAAWVTAKP
jgi:hypothetical protein